MITGGDAKFRPQPQFGFAFQFSAEVFSVRFIGLLASISIIIFSLILLYQIQFHMLAKASSTLSINNDTAK